MTRTFNDVVAKRERTPLLLGIIGPSGGGKTYSGLRLATGMQRVTGGEIYVIDTEARRSLHYADKFKFRHLEFGAPFGSLDYLAAIEHCVSKGAKIVIVDSMSHEHEGPGGLLEQHSRETTRIAKLWNTSEGKAQMAAWAKPKEDRRRMINTILQLQCNFIFCFRAKEKVKIETGKDPVAQGFMPIAGEEFVYEMAAKMLLLPGAAGVPTWASSNPGEKLMIKLPEQFRGVFKESKPLDEAIGEQLARWAAGDSIGQGVPAGATTGTQASSEALTKGDAKKLFGLADRKCGGNRQRAELLIEYLLDDRGYKQLREMPRAELPALMAVIERGVDDAELDAYSEGKNSGTEDESRLPE